MRALFSSILLLSQMLVEATSRCLRMKASQGLWPSWWCSMHRAIMKCSMYVLLEHCTTGTVEGAGCVTVLFFVVFRQDRIGKWWIPFGFVNLTNRSPPAGLISSAVRVRILQIFELSKALQSLFIHFFHSCPSLTPKYSQVLWSYL